MWPSFSSTRPTRRRPAVVRAAALQDADGREFAGPFHNQTVTLTLDDLPKHAWVKVHARPPGQTSGTSYLSASCTTA